MSARFRSHHWLSAALLLAAMGGPAFGQCPEPCVKGKLVQHVYSVADLVIPIDNAPGATVAKMPKAVAASATGKTAAKKEAAAIGTCSDRVANAPQTLEDRLIKLIAGTIAPKSWSEVGGPGSMDYYPLGMALVVTQTPEVHQQIENLLTSLRRLQEVAVAIEVRLVSVAEPFFERVGLDFEAINHAGGDRCDAKGVRDVTFLNDIEVFQLLEAIQGDRRSNVLQAPKLTMANGQSASVETGQDHVFVTDLEVVRRDHALVPVPKNETFTSGFRLGVLPVVSADRRFVHLSLGASYTPEPVVEVAPVTKIITPVYEGGAVGRPTPCTRYVQRPRFTTLTAEKAVTVPDGGTVILGGWKVERESRSEFGPPVLSKIPYINRLFKNVGYGRQTDHILLVVTPRIVVQSEEETRVSASPCPHQDGTAADSKLVPSPDLADGVGENLSKLERAQKMLRMAEFYRRTRLDAAAEQLYRQVERLCPGSQAAQMATTGLKEVQAQRPPRSEAAAEESEDPPCLKKKQPDPSHLAGPRLDKKVAKIVEKYYQACAEGRQADAQKLAGMALALDPTCFGKQREQGSKQDPSYDRN